MGGFGGSVLAMIQSLKNNKKLLRGRNGFFRKELRYSELKEYYKDSLTPIPKGKTPTKEKLEEIRIKLKKERKESLFWNIAIASAVTLNILFFSFLYINSISVKKTIRPNNSGIHFDVELERTEHFEEKLNRGISQFENKEYFLAIGNFENALRYNHSDSLTNHYLALSYFRMCLYKKLLCDKAQEHSEIMFTRQPNSQQYKKLKAYYDRKLKQI